MSTKKENESEEKLRAHTREPAAGEVVTNQMPRRQPPANTATWTIAEIEELWSRRIVRGANGVHAELAELFEPALPRAQRDCRTERTGIVVEADAFDFEVAVVEPDAGLGFKNRLPNAKGYRLVIESFAAFAEHDAGAIQRGTIQVPPARVHDRQILAELD